MGTPDFAVPCLRALLEDGREVVGVFTQPDKPVGRHAVLTPPPVKALALEHQIPVLQPAKMRDGTAEAALRALAPDLCVVTAYGRILPQALLDVPKLGNMNVHASLLPRYRGAAPVQWAVINGETRTGVTTMFMDAGMDTGDIIQQKEVEIGPEETAGELAARLSAAGAALMLESLKLFGAGEVPRVRQNEADATSIPMLTKEMGRLDLSRPAAALHNLARGLSPWPTAYLGEGEALLKLLRCRVTDGEGAPGEILALDPLVVACGAGALEFVQVQPAGRRAMSGADWARGARLQKGGILL